MADLSCIVATTDLGQDADRALPLATNLARRAGLPVEVLTVTTDDRPDELVAREQQRLVARYRLERSTSYIAHDYDVASAITDHVSGRQGALLVMATTGRSALGEHRLGPITEAVLQAVRQPVLILGPNAAERGAPPTRPTVVVDASESKDTLIAPIESWVHTFSSKATLVVEVIPPTSWPSGDDEPVGHIAGYVERLRDIGLCASGQVLRTDDVVTALVALTHEVADPVLIMASPRWEGDPSHWFATVRRVIRHTTVPVLVVPTDLRDA
jgi:nucleotide-binding universal stress UspA family protein